MKTLLIIALTFIISACNQNTEEGQKKPTRSEIISEINNTCYIYANTPGTSKSRYDAITDFFKFAQVDGKGTITELSMSESFMGVSSSRVTIKRIETNCISKLREKAL